MRKKAIFVLSLVFLFLALSAVSSASELWPNWWKSKSKLTTHGSTVTGPSNETFSVAEPAAILLLGAGLVSLGIYAKRKRDKKQ
jgi:hypothetical protein